jgi:hypothetical protein
MHLRRAASRSRFSAWLRALSAGAIALTAASEARATDEKQVCVRAVEHAQLVRLDGKLREAREGFMTCARAVCPGAIREDCTRWVTEVEASLPTVVIDAVWTDGRDVVGLTATLDGQPLPDAAGGRAVALDPGSHTFRFAAPGAAAVETRNVIREGEKNRVLHVAFTPVALTVLPTPTPRTGPMESPPPPPPAMWPLKSADERPPSSRRRPVPASAFVVGGFALAGFGGFAYAGLAGIGQLNHLRATCAPSCDPSAVNSARQEILVGDILGYVALAAAGVATWLVLTRPEVPADDPAR